MKSNPYKVKVNFVRRFTKGTLNGMRHEDSICFISNERAMDWVNGIQMKYDLDYYLEKWEVVTNN